MVLRKSAELHQFLFMVLTVETVRLVVAVLVVVAVVLRLLGLLGRLVLVAQVAQVLTYQHLLVGQPPCKAAVAVAVELLVAQVLVVAATVETQLLVVLLGL